MARMRKKKRFDRYETYELAVQDPEHTMANLARSFRRLRGREARSLREDFCGTGANSEAWVLRHADNRAVGIDLDPEPIAWAMKRRFAPGTVASARVRIVRGSVLDVRRGSFDLVAALNFSWLVFKTRREVLAYFRRARASLAKGGIFCLDLYGGPDSQRTTEDHSRMGRFSYYWEQKWWDAIRAETRCAIHFRLADGRKRKNVFTYDWRLWTLAETLELLRESGLSILEVQDEVSDSVARGTAVYRPVTRLTDSESFVVNVLAGAT